MTPRVRERCRSILQSDLVPRTTIYIDSRVQALSRAADGALDRKRPVLGRRDVAEGRLAARANVVGTMRGPVADVAHDASTLGPAFLFRERRVVDRIAGRRPWRRRLHAACEDSGEHPTDRVARHGTPLTQEMKVFS